MNLHPQYLYYLNMYYFYTGAYITHLCHNHKAKIVYVSAKQLPDDGFAIEPESILLPFVHNPHPNRFLHPSIDDPSDTEAYNENSGMDPEQPPVRIRI